jgi:hypothetical protein
VTGLESVEIYNVIRAEIVSNHVLMHWFTLAVVLALLAGVFVVEKRQTVLSVFLPLLSLAWAAAMVRFDFFIHRQAAYLRALEAQMQQGGVSMPLWETWKMSLRAASFVVPAADIIASAAIVVPTVYLLFGPARQVFITRKWRGAKLYAWLVAALLILSLCSLAVIPKLAAWGQSP